MPRRPNVLWICTDQQRFDTIHALNNEAIRTPNLDRLCAEGVAFTRAHCQSPICTPSRVSFLTGLYPSTAHGNINGNARCNLPEGVKLITRRLADAGYVCGLAGKLHIASAWKGEEERVDDGYSRFWHSHAPTQGMGIGSQYADWLEAVGRIDEALDVSNYDPKLQMGARLRDNVPFELHQTTWCCDRAIEFIDGQRDAPWLMSVNVFDPHPPYDAPRAYADRYDPGALPRPPFEEGDLAVQERLKSHVFQGRPKRPDAGQQRRAANYYGMIELVDENVGRLLRALEESGRRENTVVVFTSDHGQMLGDHGLEHKGCRFYEGLVRVPLIISWPGHFKAGRRAGGLVELTDIAPTLAELGGCDLPWTHGQSLVPILRGAADPDRHRPFVRCEFYDTLDMNWNTGRPPAPGSYATMYRDERHKLVVYHGNDYGELYDLREDPNEHRNLWEDPASARTRNDLIKRSFDASIVITDPGSARAGRF
jgi:arylsulfatase A-like enzyme